MMTTDRFPHENIERRDGKGEPEVRRGANSLLAALLFLAGAAGAAGRASVPAQAATTLAQSTGSEVVSASPEAGTIDTSFTVTGSGFAPGSLIDETFTDPAGALWQFSDWNTFNVENDGNFAFTYNLGKTGEAALLPAGRWIVSYCYDGTDSCSAIDFVIQ
jgi:hypothetical protein